MIRATLREKHPDGLWRADSDPNANGWTVQVVRLSPEPAQLVAEYAITAELERLPIDAILERAIEHTRGWINAARP